MTEWLLALVPQYGPWLLFVATFSSCVALPIPASILMLAGGGFVASGDLTLAGTGLAALTGAVAGDQTGYAVGRFGGADVVARIATKAPIIRKATDLLVRRGGSAVFLSRWFVSALGPYVNVAAGAARQPWPGFTAWSVLGEAVWVALYVGLGFAFAGNIAAASAMALNVLGMLAAGAVAAGLGAFLFAAVRAEAKRRG